jgi:hypothetical protein
LQESPQNPKATPQLCGYVAPAPPSLNCQPAAKSPKGVPLLHIHLPMNQKTGNPNLT